MGRKGTEPNRCGCGHWRSDHGQAIDECRHCVCTNFWSESLVVRPRGVIVADADPRSRATLGASLHGDSRFDVIAEAANPVEAIQWAADLEADIVVLGFDADPSTDLVGLIQAVTSTATIVMVSVNPTGGVVEDVSAGRVEKFGGDTNFANVLYDLVSQTPRSTGMTDGTESGCWHCGTVLPLRVKIVAGDRVVLCANCGKTNRLDAPRHS